MAWLQPAERDIGVLRAPVRSSLALFGLFVLVVLACALLERIGARIDFVPVAVIGAALVLFVLVALFGHARRAADYYVADRRIPASFAGIAGASAFAGLVAIGLADGGYATRAQFIASATGLVLGFLIIAFFFAPGLRRFGAYSAGDFLAARFGGTWIRLASATVAFAASFLILLAHLKIAAPLLETLLGLAPGRALYVAAGLTAMVALPGGMRSLTWTQAVQYFVIVLACLAPAGFLAAQDWAIGGTLAQDFGVLLIGNLPASGAGLAAEFAVPVIALAIGAASLPHFIARVLTAASGREAGTSMIWALLLAAVAATAGLLLAQLLMWAEGSQTAAGGDSDIVRLAAIFSAPPVVLAALVMAGMFAALFAIGQAALFSAATALSHDVWDEVIDKKGTEGRRIVVARLILIAVAAAAVPAAAWQIRAPTLLGWALALAAGGNFAPLLLGLWWRRCNEIGAIAGMVAGFGFTGLIFFLQQIAGVGPALEGWATVGPGAVTIIAVAMSLAVTMGVSLVTPAPDPDDETPARKARRRDRLPMQERPA